MLESWYFEDNGFLSVQEMEQRHTPIVDVVLKILPQSGGSIIDLGCGNGALLKEILDQRADIIPYGIDIKSERVRHAIELLPEFSSNFVSGDIFDISLLDEKFNDTFDVLLLMPGRLLETEPERAESLRRWVGEHAQHIVLYAYEDWIEKYGTITTIAAKAGFSVQNESSQRTIALAA